MGALRQQLVGRGLVDVVGGTPGLAYRRSADGDLAHQPLLHQLVVLQIVDRRIAAPRPRRHRERLQLVDVVAGSDLQHRAEDARASGTAEVAGVRVERDPTRLRLVDQLGDHVAASHGKVARIAGGMRGEDGAGLERRAVGQLAIAEAHLAAHQGLQ